jgi:glycosyltransferase involved in cell wall biosynthesis
MESALSLRVGLITGIFPPDIGGPATFIPMLMTELESSKINYTVVTLSSKGPIFSKKDSNIVIRIPRALPKALRFFFTNFVIFCLSFSVKKFYVNGLYEEFALGNLFFRSRSVAKIVGDPIWERFRNRDNSQIGISDFDSQGMNLVWRLQRKLLNFSLNQSSVLVVPGKELKKVVELWGLKPKVVQINNGVYPQLTLNQKRTDCAIVVSRLVNWKNIHKAIVACDAASIPLLIFGEGPELEKLKEIQKSLKSSTEFFSSLSRTETIEMMRKHKYFLLLSEYEGQSFALLEAMSMGMIVVVSNITANTDVVENELNGIVVNSRSQEDINQALSKISQNKPLQDSMRVSSHEYIVRNHNFHELAQLHINLLLKEV